MTDGKPNYAGMTTNERLAVSGLMAQFDAAARERNKERMIEILNAVEVQEADLVAETILRDPLRYGF